MGIQYDPLTASFRELNRMLMEKQAWDADFKLREANRGLQNMLTQSQLASAQQQQQLTQYKIAEQQRMHTPKILHLGRIVQGGPEQLAQLESDPQAMQQLTRVLDDNGEGLVYSPADRTWRHPDTKEPVKFSPYEMRFRVPAMFGIIDAHTDSVASTRQTQGELATKLQAIDKDIAAASKDRRGKAAVKELMQQRQQYVDQLKEINDFLSPEGLLTHYENKENQMMKRAAFYDSIGARELANQMKTYANNASSNKQAVLNQILKAQMAKPETKGKPSGDIILYAQEDGTQYRGKTYDKGETISVRWSPGQTEMIYPEGFDREDPLAIKKRVGEDKPTRPIFSTVSMTKQFAEDVKEKGFMGDVTAPHAKKIRDAMGAAARNIAKQHGLGPYDDRYQVYGQVKEWFALARDKYWNDMQDIQANLDTYLDKMKEMPRFQGKSDEELKKILEQDVKNTFHKQISELTGGKHERFLPSKISERQANIPEK